MWMFRQFNLHVGTEEGIHIYVFRSLISSIAVKYSTHTCARQKLLQHLHAEEKDRGLLPLGLQLLFHVFVLDHD